MSKTFRGEPQAWAGRGQLLNSYEGGRQYRKNADKQGQWPGDAKPWEGSSGEWWPLFCYLDGVFQGRASFIFRWPFLSGGRGCCRELSALAMCGAEPHAWLGVSVPNKRDDVASVLGGQVLVSSWAQMFHKNTPHELWFTPLSKTIESQFKINRREGCTVLQNKQKIHNFCLLI